MMALKDPSMVDVNHDVAESVSIWFQKFDWSACERRMQPFVTKIESLAWSASNTCEQGLAKLTRTYSEDSTDNGSENLEISSEEGDVWSDEDVKYPSPRDLDTTPRPITRRVSRAKTLHTPRHITWDDSASSDDEKQTAPVLSSTASMADAFSPACCRVKVKPAALPRSKSLHQLLTDVGQDINEFVLGRSEERQSKARRRRTSAEVFEIGSDEELFRDEVSDEVWFASSSPTFREYDQTP